MRPAVRSVRESVTLATLLTGRTDMKVGKAITAGLAGGVAMSVLGWLVRKFGLDMNAGMMLGAMMTEPGATAWVIGFMLHLMISVLIALLYAWGFEHVTHRAGVAVGLGFGVIHILLAGVVVGMSPPIAPMDPD